MLQLNKYQVIIFDCDGVLLDSNDLKVEAMRESLRAFGKISDELVSQCVDYFRSNFGKSRYHHIQHFSEKILNMLEPRPFNEFVLEEYGNKCLSLYKLAEKTPYVEEFLDSNESIKYVASGSDEKELNEVFGFKGLRKYFKAVYGSPKLKKDILKNIADSHSENNILMIGDAVSDYEAAATNGIDFLYYSPYSNVHKKMLALKDQYGFEQCNTFRGLV